MSSTLISLPSFSVIGTMSVRTQSAIALAIEQRIVAAGATGVVIDISAVEIVDSFIGRMFATIASLSKVLDAETVVVGMRPAVAITLVELGLELTGIKTALNVERGMAMIRDRLTEDDDLGSARARHED